MTCIATEEHKHRGRSRADAECIFFFLLSATPSSIEFPHHIPSHRKKGLTKLQKNCFIEPVSLGYGLHFSNFQPIGGNYEPKYATTEPINGEFQPIIGRYEPIFGNFEPNVAEFEPETVRGKHKKRASRKKPFLYSI